MLRVFNRVARFAIPRACWVEFGTVTLVWLVLFSFLSTYAIYQHNCRSRLEAEVGALKAELHSRMSDRERIEELSRTLDNWRP
jgi:hypothetical protein